MVINTSRFLLSFHLKKIFGTLDVNGWAVENNNKSETGKKAVVLTHGKGDVNKRELIGFGVETFESLWRN